VDGTTVTVKRAGDPRFGMQAPFAKEMTIATGGKTLNLSMTREATLADPKDLRSWNALTERVTVNGQTFTRSFDTTTRQVPGPNAEHTAMGWEVHAAGLEQLLLRLTKEYGVRRIHVTENGSAYRDTIAEDGRVDDPERIAYLEQHLAACARAVAQGAPLAGYFAWSLLDNFEWAYGYDKRFGLVYVDYPTQRRTIKSSGHRYAQLIRAHRAR
jgi:beta-glucosidase/6-phospho-beta-glucosidase/beta-galactosidase